MAQAFVPHDDPFDRGNARRLADVPIPKHQILGGPTLPLVGYQMVHDNTIAWFIPNTIGEALNTTIRSFAGPLCPFVDGHLSRTSVDRGLETASAA
jgi:hypothetical protein